MRGQVYIISAFVFALLIAIFAVINVNSVEVNYLFTTAESPLIIIILTSTLFGGLITGGFSIYHLIKLRKKFRALEFENNSLRQNQGFSKMDQYEEAEVAEIELIDTESSRKNS